MRKILIKVVLAAMCVAAPLAQAQTSNQVWFAMWYGRPTPSSDVSVQSISTSGNGSAVTAGSAINFICQTNFSSFNSPYDVAVNPAMGKVYVLDNNSISVNGLPPDYIYSFNLSGTPAQIAASVQIVYTMPVSQTDSNNGVYPFISGIALDPVNHYLYFDQFDDLTSTNSYVGRLSLATSSESDIFTTTSNAPTLQTLYIGQIPEWGPIAVDTANIYLGAYNSINGNNGVYKAPISGSGSFSEIATISSGNTTFTNGIIGGVASDLKSNLVYYLTSDLGSSLNYNYNTNQNAIWCYNTASNTSTLIASGYQGYPDNIAVDAANNRYYFTIGQNGTSPSTPPANYQAIYTGVVGSTAPPTLFYMPVLTGQDSNPSIDKVAIQGIYVVDVPVNLQAPVAGAELIGAESNLMLTLPVVDLLGKDSDLNSDTMEITEVNNTSTNGGSVSLNGSFVDYLPATNYVGNDQFTYTLVDSGGAQTQGTVNVNVVALKAPAANNLSITSMPGGPFLFFKGTAGQNYLIQDASAPNGTWSSLSPYLPAGASGLIEYNDPTVLLPPARFYRLHN